MLKSKGKDNSVVEFEEIKGIEMMDLEGEETGEGFFCDINTGICGPVKKNEE